MPQQVVTIAMRRCMEPRVGVEPTTCRLRIGCSTTELPRPGTENYLSICGKLKSILQEAVFLRGLIPGDSQREKGYMPQPIPMPNSRNSSSDHAIYFTRSSGRRRLRKPNAMDIMSANSSIACRWLKWNFIARSSFPAPRGFIGMQRGQQIENAGRREEPRTIVAICV